MSDIEKIRLFDNQKIRTVWVEEEEEWYFSVKDVVTILTETTNAKDYISKMRRRDEELSKGWGQIVHPPYSSDGRRASKRKLRHTGRNIPYYPVYPIKESRTVQAMDGIGGCRANQSDD